MGGFPSGAEIVIAMITVSVIMTSITMIWFGIVSLVIALLYKKWLGVNFFDAYPFRFWLMSIPAGPFAWFFFASISGRNWFRKIILS